MASSSTCVLFEHSLRQCAPYCVNLRRPWKGGQARENSNPVQFQHDRHCGARTTCGCPCWREEWAIPSQRADQGRDCGAAEIQRIAQNAPRWPDMNTKIESMRRC